MTEDERQTLLRLEQQVSEMAGTVAKLDEAFFQVPPGSPSDERPLVEWLNMARRSGRHVSWLFRLLVWSIPVVAGLGAALAQIKGWFPWAK